MIARINVLVVLIALLIAVSSGEVANRRLEDDCPSGRVFDKKKNKCVTCSNAKGKDYDEDKQRCKRVCPKDDQIFYNPKSEKCKCSGEGFRYKRNKEICECKKIFEEIDGECVELSVRF